MPAHPVHEHVEWTGPGGTARGRPHLSSVVGGRQGLGWVVGSRAGRATAGRPHPGRAARDRVQLGLDQEAQFERVQRQAAGVQPGQRVHRERGRPAAADRGHHVVRTDLGDRAERARPARVVLQRAGRADDHPAAQRVHRGAQFPGQRRVRRAGQRGPAGRGRAPAAHRRRGGPDRRAALRGRQHPAGQHREPRGPRRGQPRRLGPGRDGVAAPRGVSHRHRASAASR